MITKACLFRSTELQKLSLGVSFKLLRLGFVPLMIFLPFSRTYSSSGMMASGAGLVLAANGKSDYQVIIPDNLSAPKVGEWLRQSALLVQSAFKSNGFILEIALESKSDLTRPGIYLGDTKFARSNGFQVGKLSNWGYIHKVAGRDLIIAGPDVSAPDENDTKSDISLGTVKGVCDFLRKYVGTRFLYPGNTGIEFLQKAVISVPADLNEVNTPLVKFNYSLTWKTGFYEIANNMFPTRNLSEKILSQITARTPGTFDEGKFYKVVDKDIAFTYNWGTSHPVAYTAKKTPRYVGAQVKSIIANNILGIIKDGFGECFGLEGPVYYVSGRLLDNGNSVRAKEVANLLNEFYQAAFRESAAPMQRFYNELFHNLELYSEWMGIGGAAEYYHTKDGSTSRHLNDPLHILSYLYSPKLVTTLEAELASAKKLAVASKVKQRLALVSLELDYLRSMMTVIHLYQSYMIQPDDASWNSLLAAIVAWNAKIDSYYDTEGKMKPLPSWPELIPFKGDSRSKVGLKLDDYLAKFKQTPFAWDPKTIRRTSNK